MKRKLVAGVVAGAVLLGGGAVVGVKSYRDGRTAERNASQCAMITEAVQARNDADPVTLGGNVAVVLGDSYSQSMGLPDPRANGWAAYLGEAEGWTTYVNAIGRTGFTHGGYCGGQQFGTRVAQVLAHDPDVVIVQGGLNDEQASADEVRTAAAELLSDLSSAPRVIIVGPTDAPERDGRTDFVNEVLAEVAAESGREYVTSYGGQFEYREDGLHLADAAAHSAYAEHIATLIP